MTRIIGGVAGGRRLAVPPGGTRPTSDRVREALFSSLDHEVGHWSDCRVVDLYAGSGALGLEAASRGASAVLLVEHDRAAADVIRRNIATVGEPGVVLVVADVERVAGSAPPQQAAPAAFHLALLDPPYALETATLTDVLKGLADHGWLTSDALVVVERQTGPQALTWPEGFTELRNRRYGDTSLWFGRWNPA